MKGKISQSAVKEESIMMVCAAIGGIIRQLIASNRVVKIPLVVKRFIINDIMVNNRWDCKDRGFIMKMQEAVGSRQFAVGGL
jgi:hypothetical protein